MKRFLCFFAMAIWAVAPINAQTLFVQGFETDNDGWNAFGGSLDGTRVASGNNGVISKTGSFHAEVGTAATHWGGYSFTSGCTGASCSGTFPADGYTTAVDVYLDMAATATNDKRFDFSSAINTPAGPHRRDFVFNAGFYNDTDGTGSGPRFVISASNNAGRANSYPKNPGRSPFAITTTGWYTFQHKFYNAGGGVLAVDLSIIDASNTTIKSWTLSDPTDIIGSTVGGNRYGWFASNEFSFLAIDNSTLFKVQACLNDVYVDAATGSDANNGDIPGSAKKTVQAGVNRACPGGTVHVAGGTYVEQVEIDKTVTVRGAGTTTIVQSPNTLTKYFTTSANNYPIIWVHDANGVVIEDLVVDGAGKGNSNYRFVGIGYDNAGGTIEDVEIKDIRNTPIDGSQHGIGILANSAEGTARTLNVNRSKINGYQKNGMTCNGANLTANITNNTVTGAGAVNFIAQNGIQVSGGAAGEINTNTVRDHSYTPGTFTSTGMLLYLSNANTDDNDVIENQVGIYHINGSGLHQKNEVSASSVGTGSPYLYGIIVDPGSAPRAVPDPFDAPALSSAVKSTKTKNTIAATYTYTLDKNVLTGDGSASSFGIGAYVFGTDALDFTATANIVTKWEYGIELYKDAGATLTANIIDCNQIYDNTAFGVYNSTGIVANAVGNWWGDPTGPTHATNLGGTGDVVSDDVTFAPWGTSATCGGLALHNFVFLANEQVTIARSKHSASKGDIHSNGGIYFQRGDPNTYYGNLFAVGAIKIDKEIKIDGDATAGGKITLSGNAKILGTKSQYAAVAAIPLPSLSYSAGGPNVTVAKGKTVSIAPGSYNNVIVNDGGTLKFVAGTYNLNRLETKDDENTLYFDVSGGPVILNIVTNLKLSEEVTVKIVPDGEDGSEKVTFNTMQSTQVLLGKESYVLGNIIAPNAEVYLAKNVSFRGAISAKRITVDRDVYSLHHSSDGTLPFQKGSTDDGEELLSEQSIVTNYVLSQNYPNPFNPSTRITFALPEAGHVQLHIYNSFGQLVRTLANRELAQGWHELMWDGRNQNGQTVATGVYLYRIIVQDQTGAATFSETRRMSFVK